MSTLAVTNLRPQSGSNFHFTGSTHITGDLIVSETVIAKELRTELTQSVVLFQSGSSQFGDSIDDSHEFTGSVKSSGSINLDGTLVIPGFVDVSASLAAITSSFSSSVHTRLTTNEVDIAALTGSFSSSIASRVTANEVDIAALTGSFSSSVASRLDNNASDILAVSASIAEDIAAITGSFSSSIASRVTTEENNVDTLQAQVTSIHAYTASSDSEITALMSATSSYALDATLNIVSSSVDSLVAATASYASTGSNTYTGNQIVSASVLFTLQQITGSAPAAPATGSLIVSGSPVQLYIYNGSGSGWNRV